MSSSESYKVLIIGDFHFGESYAKAGAPMLRRHGYEHSVEHLRPFAETSDYVVVNLETPLVDPDMHPSPLHGKKSYIHWADPERSGEALRALGVDAVSLANNHTLDHGAEGLESTFKTLESLGIPWFGAGRTIQEAETPFSIQIPERLGSGEISLHGSFQYSQKHDRDFGFYATNDSSGCAPLVEDSVPLARSTATRADSFQVAFPHWGQNYKWRSDSQYRLAHRFLNKDYDLVLGHGGHSLQEVHRKQRRWVVYGLGNGMFNSGGRWQHFEEQEGILPFSFWAILEVHLEDEMRRVELKLYPVYSDNSQTGFQPGPVSAVDFARTITTLASKPTRPWRFDNEGMSTGKDNLGHHILLDLGEWPVGEKPSRLIGALAGDDPSDWPLRSVSPEIEDEVLRINKHLGATLLAMGARKNGGQVKWITDEISIIAFDDKRFLTQRYRAHESAVAATIVNDKVVTADFLARAGVPSPKTVLVKSADAAIEAAWSIDGPVVVKPRNGKKSRGVSTGLVQESEIREAFEYARKYGDQVLVQQHIELEAELRVMASADEVLAVNGRRLPHVIGDGKSNIESLINDKNSQRKLNPSLVNRPIPIDDILRVQLRKANLSLESVPALGENVVVRNIAGLSAGADTDQVLDETSSTIKEAASSAVAAIPGLGWGGVDVIVERGTGLPYVIEVNTEAGYGSALFPTYGNPKNVGDAVWSLREKNTLPCTKGSPRTIGSNECSQALEVEGNAKKDSVNIKFSDVLNASLKRQGFSAARKGQNLLEVGEQDGGVTWITRNGLGVMDRSVTRNVLKRHNWTRRILSESKISRTSGRRITGVAELMSFLDKGRREVLLNSITKPWQGPSVGRYTAAEAKQIKHLSGAMWVQARPAGQRLRILAGKEQVWMVLTANTTSRIEEDNLHAAEVLAVEAVRAVPELNWAIVDLVIRPDRASGESRRDILIEGISLAPNFEIDDVIIAGNFDDFSSNLIMNNL